MRTVDVATLTQNIKEMCIEANHFLSEDMKTAFTKAEQQEKAPLGKQILQQLQQNMDIAGKDMCNPTAEVLSAAMMLDHLGELEIAERIRAAVRKVYAEGSVLTADICKALGSNQQPATCTQFTDALIAALEQ